MGKLVINSYDEFAAHLGEELGASEWLQVDQDRINLFADATLDHQWIHVDAMRARPGSSFTASRPMRSHTRRSARRSSASASRSSA